VAVPEEVMGETVTATGDGGSGEAVVLVRIVTTIVGSVVKGRLPGVDISDPVVGGGIIILSTRIIILL
jgi:hypothetical protein